MTSTEVTQEQSGAGTDKKKRLRSPAYPAIDLAEALQKAEAMRTQEGKSATNVDTALHHWDYKPKSGAGLAALSALIKFGLLEDEGRGGERRVHLTPLALKILLDDRPESPDRLTAVREAALMPSIHDELWKKYQGALPSDSTLRYYLRHDRAFQDDGAQWCIKNLRSTLTYARLPESANISPEAEDTTQPAGEAIMTPPAPMTQEAAIQDQNVEKKTPTGTDVQPVMRTLQIPLTNAPWAMIQVPYPMSEEDWDELMGWFGSMAKPLTKGAAKPKQP